MKARLLVALATFSVLAVIFTQEGYAQRGHIPPGLADKLMKGSHPGLYAHYLSYQAFTPDTLVFPLNKTFPKYKGHGAAFELLLSLQRDRIRHRIQGQLALPVYLEGQDSLGSMLMMDSYGSYYQFRHGSYSIYLPLMDLGAVVLSYGAIVSVRHQKTSLSFLPEGQFVKKEIMAGLGPGISLEAGLSDNLFLQAESFALCYLPYVSGGRFSDRLQSNHHSNQSFRPVVYALAGRAHIRYDFGEQWQAKLGYTYFYAQGLGGVSPSFRPEQAITYTHDTTHGLFAGIAYIIPPRWTRRKVDPPCPLNR